MRSLGIGCLLIVLLAATTDTAPLLACTGITLRAKDGSIVYARTMEFGHDFDSELIVIPRGHAFRGTASSGPGMQWTAWYALVGANGLHLPIVLDGVNECGLACGLFYFPGYARYQDVAETDASRTVAPWELATWILSQFANVEEVREKLPEIRVANVDFAAWGVVPPAHFVVHDSTGNCLVVEYVDGKLNLYDNPIGVITNSPAFDWHLTNLRNYLNLTPANAHELDIDGVKLNQFGQGSGMHGLPGDFTPPSRFIRAVALARTAIPGETAADAVDQAFHILNNFDIPFGSIRSPDDKQVEDEITEWTSASDLRNKRYYFHTHGNRRTRMVDLSRMDLDAKGIVTIPMSQERDVEDLTP